MRLARVIDEASAQLAEVESVVGTARHVIDVAAEAERRGGRIAGRLRTAAVMAVAGVAVIGGVIAVKALLDRRRSPTSTSPVLRPITPALTTSAEQGNGPPLLALSEDVTIVTPALTTSATRPLGATTRRRTTMDPDDLPSISYGDHRPRLRRPAGRRGPRGRRPHRGWSTSCGTATGPSMPTAATPT